jgi:hypothetical protein
MGFQAGQFVQLQTQTRADCYFDVFRNQRFKLALHLIVVWGNHKLLNFGHKKVLGTCNGDSHQSFDQRMIRLVPRIEINFHLSLSTVRTLFDIRSHDFFLQKVTVSYCEFWSFRSVVNVVEGFGFGRVIIMSLPIVWTFGEANDDDPKGGAGYLTSHCFLQCLSEGS